MFKNCKINKKSDYLLAAFKGKKRVATYLPKIKRIGYIGEYEKGLYQCIGSFLGHGYFLSIKYQRGAIF